MKSKLIIALSAIIATTACAFGFSACGNGGGSDDSQIHTHTYTKETVEPTCNTAGYTEYTCSCGHSYRDSEKPLLRHEYVGGSCSRCGTPKPTEGLKYELSYDKTHYNVTGIGVATANDIVIADVYNGLPVLSIDINAFENCDSLTSVTIPDGIKNISHYAFKDCDGLKSVTIGNGVTDIYDWAFYRCGGLTSIAIPDGVINIGYSAFRECASLASVIIGDGVKSIAVNAFDNTAYYNDVNSWQNGVLYIGKHLIKAKENVIGEVQVKADTLTIADYAFCNCVDLTGVTVSDSVTAIGNSAFYGCNGLTHLRMGNGVKTIGESAFHGCNITGVTIPESVESIGIEAFYGCSLETVNWNAAACATTELYGRSIFEKTGLSTVIIGDNVTSIPDYMFENCYRLKSVIIPDSVKSIGKYAFYGCRELTDVTIPEDVTFIDYQAFYGCSSLETVSWNATACTTTELYSCSVFDDCTNLTTVIFGDNVTAIPDYAFEKCSSLQTVTIGSAVKTIGEYAFGGCGGLTRINNNGPKEQWYAIEKGYNWDYETGDYKIYCTEILDKAMP